MLVLRDYQQAAVNAVYDYLRTKEGNPCIAAPTGSGKSSMIAQICGDAVSKWNGRVLILAHVKELLEQTASAVRRLCPNLPIGIYSAGLRSRRTQEQVIIAGIQSVYKKACELDRFDLILADECHLLPPDGEGMYQTFLKDAKVVNPHVRLIGFTATPYRLKSGMLCGKDHLTTGFDAPNIDCVVLLRPTASPGFYYQMVGRGFRLHPSKTDCLVLDYGGNILRHGPVDAIQIRDKKHEGSGEPPAKECPQC